MENIIKTSLLNLAIAIGAEGCSCHTEEFEQVYVSESMDGYAIRVKKINSDTIYKGLISGIKYGTSHSYHYSFTLSPGRIYWEHENGVPKELKICSKDLYIYYLQRIFQEQSGVLKTIVQPHYAKHVDKRYFFKFLGEQYWVTATKADYDSVGDCKSLAIPNDNELEINP
ncbi:MAG: hypothetical protein HY080_11990 [Gammaproteobacteria bacterium]|nr:hypothetical protein [Gammaproteobacteria bacterium]